MMSKKKEGIDSPRLRALEAQAKVVELYESMPEDALKFVDLAALNRMLQNIIYDPKKLAKMANKKDDMKLRIAHNIAKSVFEDEI